MVGVNSVLVESVSTPNSLLSPQLNPVKIENPYSIIAFESEIIEPGNVIYKRGSFINKNNLKLVCQEWIPPQPKGALIIIHGYGDHGQTTLADDARVFAKLGFASFIFDQQGHGLSEGLQCYVESFDDLMDDSILFIDDIKSRFPALRRFVYSCSMGGAVGLLVSLKRPDLMNGGLVLLAPLIKLDDTMIPNYFVVSFLTLIASAFPSLPIVPGDNVLDRNIKDPKKREEHATHPLTYKGRARLGTGLAILKVTSYLQSRLADVKVPLFIAHGSEDKVSSPEVSKELHKASTSIDKTIKIYDGMWHGLTSEPECQIIFNDILNWMVERL